MSAMRGFPGTMMVDVVCPGPVAMTFGTSALTYVVQFAEAAVAGCTLTLRPYVPNPDEEATRT